MIVRHMRYNGSTEAVERTAVVVRDGKFVSAIGVIRV